MRLATLIARFYRHFEKIKELSRKNLKEYLIFTSLAMECFQAVNALIEIGSVIVSERKLGFPSKYSEIFYLLMRNKIIDEETFNVLKQLIYFRNLISHEYYKISEEELAKMVNLIIEVEKKFVKEIKSLI